MGPVDAQAEDLHSQSPNAQTRERRPAALNRGEERIAINSCVVGEDVRMLARIPDPLFPSRPARPAEGGCWPNA